MRVIQLKEQLSERTLLQKEAIDAIIPFFEDGEEVVSTVRRGKEENKSCLRLYRSGNEIFATGSYYVGIDWIVEKQLAVQVCPKMNSDFEIDYVRMLNETLAEAENFEHLTDLITIHFDKPSIKINQQQDTLSMLLITEFISLLHQIVKKGLKKSFYIIENNLKSKVKGKISIGQNIRQNLLRGKIADIVCRYQVYDIDSNENRILKKALKFSMCQLKVYSHAVDTKSLESKSKYISPYFDSVSDEVSVNAIKSFKGNPVFKEYYRAVEVAQLILKRYSYDITTTGKEQVYTPPFWIDMSKLFELYVFHHLKRVFRDKNEITYHVNAHYQELDYLLNPTHWTEPYVIDAKYKPDYKSRGVSIDDARQLCGYARLSRIYKTLRLNEDEVLPVKCLIVHPDQTQQEKFTFSNLTEPQFDKVSGYVRFYKVGIRLPVIEN